MKKFIKIAVDKVERKWVNPIRAKGKTKFFCIGRNKTGTTSLKLAFKELGFSVGYQRDAERLINDYERNDFINIINYCHSAQVFQDVPFSYTRTFKELDKAFPGSKFILTVRDNPEQWYNSLVKFHAKMFGKGNTPSKEDLQSANYIWKGWAWQDNRINYGSPEDNPYQKEYIINNYLEHNRVVIEYFKNRPDDLLVINLAEKDSYQNFLDFIGVKSDRTEFPWENRTADKKTRL